MTSTLAWLTNATKQTFSFVVVWNLQTLTAREISVQNLKHNNGKQLDSSDADSQQDLIPLTFLLVRDHRWSQLTKMEEETAIWHAWNFKLPSGSQAPLLCFWRLWHMVQLQPPQSIKVRKRKHSYDNNSYYLHLADGCVILHHRWKNLNFILAQIHKSERNKMPRLLEQVQTIKTTNQPPTKPFSWAFVALIPAMITTNPGKQLTPSRIWIWKESQKFQLQTCSTKKHNKKACT